jgi:hypothetical protein
VGSGFSRILEREGQERQEGHGASSAESTHHAERMWRKRCREMGARRSSRLLRQPPSFAGRSTFTSLIGQPTIDGRSRSRDAGAHPRHARVVLKDRRCATIR